MRKRIYVGMKVGVSGRFIPEERLEDFQNDPNHLNQFGYPEITLNGKISFIEKGDIFVDFDIGVNMILQQEELLFS